MFMFLSAAALLICFFICVVNYSFQKSRYKTYPKEYIRKFSRFNSPGAWLTYSLLTLIVIGYMLFAAFTNVYAGFSIQNTSTTTPTTSNSFDINPSESSNGN